MKSRRYRSLLKRASRHIPDALYLHLIFFRRFGRLGNFRNPKTFNEKLQWLKLNYREPDSWKLVDKIEVKKIVGEIIGEEFIIPTIATYENVSDIDFSTLPDSFVIKCTHDSGGVVVVKDKSKLDVYAAQRTISKSFKRNYYYYFREPQYLDIKPRIIVEPYLEDEETKQLLDYKFFCFDGKVKALFVASDRASGALKFDYFDPSFKPLHIRQPYPNSEILPKKPEKFEEMVKIAEKLSQGHPHIRVDLYEVNGKVYFGELTFYHFAGTEPFDPKEWDQIFGDWLTLPKKLPSNS